MQSTLDTSVKPPDAAKKTKTGGDIQQQGIPFSQRKLGRVLQQRQRCRLDCRMMNMLIIFGKHSLGTQGIDAADAHAGLHTCGPGRR
ncbi:hypothetical protein TKWG_07025 [Advenella kashmirensis WT001]|uniref:Uncharacterized protein n=1 Tax=Advenella kashmirensis (strain DSM 17095 / LMG 22695 / WT001) TaxID=1036672 RepID=I3UA00_ADVKW|nr:hypothetical protein TKWG_07025 [Advenella kashmirensis WT001]